MSEGQHFPGPGGPEDPMNTPTSDSDEALFDREGHLTELTIDRLLAGELGTDAVDAHTRGCPRCAELIETLQARDAEFMASSLGQPAWLAELTAPNEVVDLDAHRRERPAVVSSPSTRATVLPMVGALFAMAAAIALVMTVSFDDGGEGTTVVPAPADGIRLKGRPLTLEVYAKGQGEPRQVGSGDPVYPGERVAFKIYPHSAGYTMILGVDDKGHAYQCYPQGGRGQSVAVEASTEGIDVKAAMKLDSVLGSERLVALSCPAPFTYAEVVATLKERAQDAGDSPVGSLKTGCDQHEVRLVKRAAENP